MRSRWGRGPQLSKIHQHWSDGQSEKSGVGICVHFVYAQP